MSRHTFVAAAGLRLTAVFLWQSGFDSQTPTFDLVVRGGRVVDGTGNPWFLADVGIKGDTIAAIAQHLDATGARVFVGHGAVRVAVVGMSNRAAKPDELARMRDLVRSAMREGAFGSSTGLFYVPANYAPLEEVIDLAHVAGEFGGIHQSHMRDEGVKVVDPCASGASEKSVPTPFGTAVPSSRPERSIQTSVDAVAGNRSTTMSSPDETPKYRNPPVLPLGTPSRTGRGVPEIARRSGSSGCATTLSGMRFAGLRSR